MRAVATLLVVAFALVACGGHAAPPAPAGPPARDVAAIADRPCELLGRSQAAGFGFDLPPQPLTGVLGNRDCEWTSRGGRVIHLSTFTNNQTLAALRDLRPRFAYFHELAIGGYPAIAIKYVARLSVCSTSVEPARYQSITLTYQSLRDRVDACALGGEVLAQVVMNVPLQR